MTKTKEPSALELAEELAIDIANARAASERITTAIREADAEIAAAEAHHREKFEDVVLAREGAEENYRAATVRLSQASQQRAGLDREQEQAVALMRRTEARARALRVECLPEFVVVAEERVSELEDAAAALAEPLSRYLAAWQRAQETWQPLSAGVRARVEAQDHARGQYRSGEALERDLRVPQCPLSADALRAIGTVLPRPRAMSDGYVGDPFTPDAPSSDDTVPVPTGPDGSPFIFGDSES